jgi:7-carboxy-7-deazaguanine synthase
MPELMTKQKGEPKSIQDPLATGLDLPLMEAFYTLQGEGAHSGRAAYFIRLGGCDVGCVWCDVKESWDADRHPVTPVSDIVAAALRYPARLAVITGGEPLLYNLNPLTTALQAQGFAVHLETSGAHPLSGSWDWICFSPKKFKAALPEAYPAADELKVVVYHLSDLDWAVEQARNVRESCLLFLQPEWSRSRRMLPEIIEFIKANPRWRISLQSHKYMEIP